MIGMNVLVVIDSSGFVDESNKDDNSLIHPITLDDAKNPDDFPPTTTPPVDIELVALSLVSVDPINVAIPGPVDFNVNGDDISCPGLSFLITSSRS